MRFLRRGEGLTRWIVGCIENGTATQARLGPRRANVLQHSLVTEQRLTGPVHRNEAEQLVLHRIPLRRTRRQVSHGDGESELVGQSLQLKLPAPTGVAIRVATICLNQQLAMIREAFRALFYPPTPNGSSSECRSLMGTSHYDKAPVIQDIVDAIWDGNADCIVRVIALQHVERRKPPRPSCILEVANQFAFLRIHANHGDSLLFILPANAFDIPHLLIAISVLLTIQSLMIRSQAVSELEQQPPHGFPSDFEIVTAQCPGELANRLTCPLHSADWVPGRLPFQYLTQSGQEARILFSPVRRPPPMPRTRPWSRIGSACVTSLRPRLIVFRLSPVISFTRCTPPRPHCIAKTPAKRRRLFSLRLAITRFIALCSRDTPLFGCRRHSSHPHTCSASPDLFVILTHCARTFLSCHARVSLHPNSQVIYGQTLSATERWFYDLRSDPYQMTNLADSSAQRELAAQLHTRLVDWNVNIPWMHDKKRL